MEEEIYKLKYSDEYLDHIEKHLKSGQKKLLIKINSLLDELETHPTICWSSFGIWTLWVIFGYISDVLVNININETSGTGGTSGRNEKAVRAGSGECIGLGR